MASDKLHRLVPAATALPDAGTAGMIGAVATLLMVLGMLALVVIGARQDREHPRVPEGRADDEET